jgi:hypothetical protein
VGVVEGVLAGEFERAVEGAQAALESGKCFGADAADFATGFGGVPAYSQCMKIISGILATDGVDSHGERLSPELLRQIVESRAGVYVLATYEHDIRVPPIGRCARSELQMLDNGRLAVVVETEVFEESDQPGQLIGDGREVILPYQRLQGVKLSLDRADATHPDGKELCEGIRSAIPAATVELASKKNLEPISVLAIAFGTYVLGSISSGYLKEIGKDGWIATKAAWAKYFGNAPRKDRLFDLVFVVRDGDRECELHVVAMNPSPAVTEQMLTKVASMLDSKLHTMLIREHRVSRLVFDFQGDELCLRYGINADAVPFPLSALPKDIKFEGLGLSVELRAAEA